MRILIPLLLAAVLLAACGGSIEPTAAVSGSSGSNSATGLTISGNPPASVVSGQTYSFVPITTAQGGTLVFSIGNLPAWASFNTSTGALTGTPGNGDLGTDSNILISVSDGALSASLPAFSITISPSATGTSNATGSASLSWTPPTQNTDGSTLTDLVGYTIFYGTSASALTQSIQLASSSATSYVVDNLSAGTYYFSIAAYTSDGTQSAQSNIGSKTIP